jgi:hypothetical protein
MKELDRLKLREELIKVYSEYVKDPTDPEMKKAARRLHEKYGNVGHLVDRNMMIAVSLLANIGWETITPKPAREAAEELVFNLATRKA